MQNKKDEYVASFKGSDFSLKDMNNNTITQESFKGPLTAIFFGFTHCPDVCPMTLNKMDIVLDKLKKEGWDGLTQSEKALLFNVSKYYSEDQTPN